MAGTRTKLILDVDTGTDDAVALMLAALVPSRRTNGNGISWPATASGGP